jgi:hypothetical protein
MFVCAVVVIAAEAGLEPVRWWWSPPIALALAITPRQSAALDRLYEESLLPGQHASEAIMGLTDEIAKRLRDGLYDEELLHDTERLVGARLKQCELRRHALKRAVQVLTPNQRVKLTRLIAEKRIVE